MTNKHLSNHSLHKISSWNVAKFLLIGLALLIAVSYTHLTLPTILLITVNTAMKWKKKSMTSCPNMSFPGF